MVETKRQRTRVIVIIAALSGPAWILIALGNASFAIPVICTSDLLWSVPALETYAYFFTYVSPFNVALSWALMIAAMMLPTHVEALGYVGSRSFKHARPLQEFLLISGYFAAWMLFGFVFLGTLLTVRLASPAGGGPLIVALIIAIVWQTSPIKQIVLNKCHFRPVLAAFTPVAQRDVFIFGLTSGLWCIASCWALMLVSLIAPDHHVAIMALVAIYLWIERLEPACKPEWRIRLPGRGIRLAAAFFKQRIQVQLKDSNAF